MNIVSKWRYKIEQYHNTLSTILTKTQTNDRTGVGIKQVFGVQHRYDVSKSFPLITTKFMPFKSILSELLWMLEGSGNERRLAEIRFGEKSNKPTIWSANTNAPYWKNNPNRTNEDGDMGRVYGKQWRDWNGVTDQIANLISGLKTDPTSRRHIVTAWNPSELDKMALPPCHMFFQCHVDGDTLHLQMYQRSADMFLGVPFNIAFYSLLLMIIAQEVNLKPGEFIHDIGNAHIYSSHYSQAEEQLENFAMGGFPQPTVEIANKPIFDLSMNDFTLINYKSYGKIFAPMAI